MNDPVNDDAVSRPARPLPAGRNRRWLLAGAAALAAVAGATVSLRQSGRPDPAAPSPSSPPAPAGGDAAALWQRAFETSDGAPLDLQALRGRPLLVNFWATWCPPCIEELPMLDRFHREQAGQGAGGFRVLGIAIDQPSKVRAFLQKLPVAFPIAMGGLDGTGLATQLGNSQGALPFTVVLAADGTVAHRKMGQVTLQDLQEWRKST
jgi:thiol-disulfide isomerase/thioredoxin